MTRCGKCHQRLPESAYALDRRRASGRQHWCKECKRRESRAWRERNWDRAQAYDKARDPERYQATRRAWRALNAPRLSETAKAWREANPERQAYNVRLWREANPERTRQYARNRRARLAGAVMDGVAVDYFAKMCFWCQRAPAECIDHIYPLAVSRDDRAANKVPACSACNRAKHTSDPVEWMARQGRNGRLA
jgi:hypothetical protein